MTETNEGVVLSRSQYGMRLQDGREFTFSKFRETGFTEPNVGDSVHFDGIEEVKGKLYIKTLTVTARETSPPTNGHVAQAAGGMQTTSDQFTTKWAMETALSLIQTGAIETPDKTVAGVVATLGDATRSIKTIFD